MGKMVVLKKTMVGMTVFSVLFPLLFDLERSRPDWAEKLDYQQDELYPIRVQINSIPLVEVRVNGTPLWVKFDTGCSTGFSLTSAVEKKSNTKSPESRQKEIPMGRTGGKRRLRRSPLSRFLETDMHQWRRLLPIGAFSRP